MLSLNAPDVMHLPVDARSRLPCSPLALFPEQGHLSLNHPVPHLLRASAFQSPAQRCVLPHPLVETYHPKEHFLYQELSINSPVTDIRKILPLPSGETFLFSDHGPIE